MDAQHQARADIEATIAAHDDDGHGWCAGEHEGPLRYPCQTRLWMEHVLDRQNRRRR
jgi:hypothetical protein